jgi:hypothetical protein
MTRPPSPLPVVRSKHEEQLRPDRVCPGPGYSVHSVIEASNLLRTPRLRLLNCDRFFFVFCSADDLTINFRGDGRQRDAPGPPVSADVCGIGMGAELDRGLPIRMAAKS